MKHFCFFLTLNLFLGPIAGFSIAEIPVSATNSQGNEFQFSDQVCGDWANDSAFIPSSNVYGGEGISSDHFANVDNLSGFHRIESGHAFKQIINNSNKEIPAGTKLFFPNDIEINLTNMFGITIKDDVTIFGLRGFEGKVGAKFYTKSFANPETYVDQKPLFVIRGNNVSISGVIFSGPAPIGDIGNYDWKEGRFGVKIDHPDYITESVVNITNSEFYGFGHAGISVEKTFTSNILEPRVVIEHNYLHDHMQFQSGVSGTGYGIVINNAYPLIQYNEFGLNRHDVAHTGFHHTHGSRYISGYEFAYNLLHLGATDHMVDMHCYGVENLSSCQDYAGDFLYVHHNLFYDSQIAVAIRGAPTIGACLHDNEFIDPETNYIERKSSQGGYGVVSSFNNSFNQLRRFNMSDSDMDGIGDRSDFDDDNDGIRDFFDAFPLNSTEYLDTDVDGIGDNADLDDDGDGVPDSLDDFPLDSLRHSVLPVETSRTDGTNFFNLEGGWVGLTIVILFGLGCSILIVSKTRPINRLRKSREFKPPKDHSPDEGVVIKDL